MDVGFECHSRMTDTCQLTLRKGEGAADAAVKSNTGCVMVSLSQYADTIQHEACMAAEKAAMTEATCCHCACQKVSTQNVL